MRNLHGKVAFITGGASGIGSGMAEAFLASGMKVAIADIDERATTAAVATLTSLAKSPKDVLPVHLDVTDRSAWERAAREAESAFGQVDILCNNAGVAGISRPAAEIPEDEWRWQANINFHGVINGVQCFVPRLRALGGGHIVNTASIGGVSPIRHFGDYISAKFAVVGLSGTLRLELAEYDIGVSALCPGSVKSGLGENTVRQRPARAAFADDRSDFIRKSGWRYIEPIEAGRIVVRGVRGNWPFIFTHPEDRALIEARHTAMMAAFDALGAET